MKVYWPCSVCLAVPTYAAAQPLVDASNMPSLAPIPAPMICDALNSPNTFWLRASYGDEAEKSSPN